MISVFAYHPNWMDNDAGVRGITGKHLKQKHNLSVQSFRSPCFPRMSWMSGFPKPTPPSATSQTKWIA